MARNRRRPPSSPANGVRAAGRRPAWGAGWRDLLLAAVLAVAATLGVFGRSLDFGFQDLDDRANVADNPRFLPVTFAGIAAFWRDPYLQLYAPVTYTFFAVESRLAARVPTAESPERLDPRVFHAGNLCLHAAATVLVFVVLAQLTAHPAAACLGSLLFCLHPLHVESVAWITETKGLLSAVLGLGAMVALLRAASTPGGSAGLALAGSGLYLASLLAKPSAVSVPLIAAAGAWYLGRQVCARAAPWLAAWLAAAVVLAWVTKSQQADEHLDYLPGWGERLLVAGDALTFYAARVIVPWPLAPDYGRTPQVVLSWPTSAVWALLPAVAAAGVLVGLGGQTRRAVVAAAAIFTAGLLPVLGLVPFGFQNFSTVADRYAYLALLGPAAGLAFFIAARPRRPARAAAIAWITVLAGLSFVQTGYWSDTPTLFTRTLEVNPHSHLAHEKLGAAARRAGDAAAAAAHFERAAALKPDSAALHNKLGDACFRMGDLDRAEHAFRRALAVDPRLKEAHYNLGNVMVQRGRDDEARRSYQAALEIDPVYAPARNNLAILDERLRAATAADRPAASP